jgi:transcription initiation factor TFIIB
MNELARLADTLYLPKHVETDAALIYRKTLSEGLIRGRSINGIAAAALYAACRLNQTTRTLKDIVTASDRSRKEISRHYRLLQQKLRLDIPLDEPDKYVSTIASHNGLSQHIQNTAMELLQKVRQMKATMGRSPAGIAAAALYIATRQENVKITQDDLAEAAGVTTVTVRNRYKQMLKDLDYYNHFYISKPTDWSLEHSGKPRKHCSQT